MGGKLKIGKFIDLEWGKDNVAAPGEKTAVSDPGVSNTTDDGRVMSQELATTITDKPYGRAPQSTDRELAADVKAAMDIVMPVHAGRQTVPDTVSLFELFQQWAVINPQFNPELIKVIDHLGKWHPDLSKALENLSLARTNRTLYFDKSVPATLQADAITHLNKVRKSWYPNSFGEAGLINALIRQAGIAGALSFEMVPKQDLSGIENIVLATPANIYFLQDQKTYKYMPVQKVPDTLLNRYRNAGLIQGVYKPLNPFLYKYIAMTTDGDYPYGIPPFLSALESIVIQKDMIENLKTVIQRLGLLGFLKIMLNKPAPKPAESKEAYQARVDAEVEHTAKMIKIGFKSGFMIGWNNITDMEMQGVTNNVEGASELVNINDVGLISGLKEDLSLMNRPNSTTETFANVILKLTTKRLTNYQELIAHAMDQMDLMELFLVPKFRKIVDLESEFESVMLGDQVKEQNAYKEKVNTAKQLWTDGIIDKTTYANIAGYDEPANDDPPVNPDAPATDPNAEPGADGGKADPKKPKEKKPKADDTSSNATPDMVDYIQGEGQRGVDQFDYCAEHYASHNHGTIISFGADPDEEFYAEYNAAMAKHFRHAVAMSARKVRNSLARMAPNTTLGELQTNILFNLYTTWGEEYVGKVRPDIDKFVREAYRFFRTTKKPFVGKRELGNVPEATYNLTDIRVQEFFKRSDNLYLGKFIFDDDSRQRINSWIRAEYIDGDRAIGGGTGSDLDRIEDGFINVVGGEQYKQRRIVDTTVTRLRSIGAIKYMEQAGITGYEIVSLGDRVTCDYCKGMDGKVFSISAESARIDKLMASAPEETPNITPFLTSLYRGSEIEGGIEPFLKAKPAIEIQASGGSLAPFHPHCRCRNVAADI